MNQFKDRLLRSVRANLNHLLDQVKDFEERGGIKHVFDDDAEPAEGWEDIGLGASRSAPPGPQPSVNKTLHDYYANLEVPFGSDLPTVKAAYRRLMRNYHPDKFANDPQMESKATELSQELAHAYQRIESYLKTGRF
ncbi:MAG: DnaJ domain-containing protein [Bradymonadaceae bacterium]|nr:DnaJ domain-containing protein [Lujinxingiaceae bacterium]